MLVEGAGGICAREGLGLVLGELTRSCFPGESPIVEVRSNVYSSSRKGLLSNLRRGSSNRNGPAVAAVFLASGASMWDSLYAGVGLVPIFLADDLPKSPFQRSRRRALRAEAEEALVAAAAAAAVGRIGEC
jgi:hypothetical protein